MNNSHLFQLHKLVTLVTNLSRGAVALALYNREEVRREVTAALRERLASPIYEVTLSVAERNPVEAIRALKPQPGDVVCLSHLEDAFPEALGYLDLQREVLAALDIFLICWLNPTEFRGVADVAPNFYAVRSGTFDFTCQAEVPSLPERSGAAPRVFVSYASDASEYALELADHLRRDGIDCRIDQYDLLPGAGWSRWIEEQIEQAAFVLLICTQAYLRQWQGGLGERGEGVFQESRLIAQALSADTGAAAKFVPVLLTPEDVACIPDRLGDRAYYDLSAQTGYTRLYRLLTGQSGLPIVETREALNIYERSVVSEPIVFSVSEPTRGEVEAVNPFVWRGGIRDPQAFFDRERERATLRSFLRVQGACQVVGPRRIGKTSLLLYVRSMAAEWDPRYAVAYVDLQDAMSETVSGWLEVVSRQWGWTPAVTSQAEFSERVETMVAEEDRRPVLCLDEFELFGQRRTEFTPGFFLNLRACAGKGLSILTASRQSLSALTEPGDPTSPFYNVFALVRLERFSESDAADFVSLPRPGVPAFAPEEKTVILNFARCHPLALQVASYHVLEAKLHRESLGEALRQADDNLQGMLPTGW